MIVSPKELVEAGIYPDEKTAMEEALRILWRERPQLRIDWAIYQYSKRQISLARAAALAGVSFDRMKELLVDRGQPLRLGHAFVEEVRRELDRPDPAGLMKAGD